MLTCIPPLVCVCVIIDDVYGDLCIRPPHHAPRLPRRELPRHTNRQIQNGLPGEETRGEARRREEKRAKEGEVGREARQEAGREVRSFRTAYCILKYSYIRSLLLPSFVFILSFFLLSSCVILFPSSSFFLLPSVFLLPSFYLQFARPTPRTADSIGPWKGVFNNIGHYFVLANVAVRSSTRERERGGRGGWRERG